MKTSGRWQHLPGLVAVLAVLLLVAHPSTVLAQVPDDFPGFRVLGRHLFDVYGNKVILVGINKMVIWTDRDGLPAFPEIAMTGANVVRIVWLTEGSAEELDIAISNSIANKLIPMVDCHDSTGEWEELPTCVDYWVRPDVAAVLRKHEAYLLINIANEAGEGVVPTLEFQSAYELAIRRIRAAGLHVPLIIDAQGYGKDIDGLQANGPYLIQADPDHNIMFSIHMWWPSAWRGTAVTQVVIDEIAESVAMDLPLIIGEFANKGPGCACCIPYETIIEQAHLNEVGYLPWSWGPGNNDCDEMDMTEDGTFDTLHGWGIEVAITSTHSIRNIAVRPDWIVNATPVAPPTPAPTSTPFPAPEGVLSTGKQTEVSSVEATGLGGSNAVDGRLNTRWSSAYSDPQSLTVDLGSVQPIARIVLEWEAAYGREYKLQISGDGETWSDIVHVTDGNGGLDDHLVSNTGRYVRLLGLRRGTEWGYSLYEFWVFDRDDVAIPEPAPGVDIGAPTDYRPDLVIRDITWSPDPILPGDAVTFRATIENRGYGGTIPDPFRCAFQIDGETVAWGEIEAAVSPGGSTSCVAEVSPDGSGVWQPGGERAFIVLGWVDDEGPQAHGRVDESNENNNMLTAYAVIRAPTATAAPTALPEKTATLPAAADTPQTAEPSPTVVPEPMRDSGIDPIWIALPVGGVLLLVAFLALRVRRRA